MRFCKFVPLDTFSIIQSLRKTSSTSITPPVHCLDWENYFFPCTDSLEGKPLAFYLEVPASQGPSLALYHDLLNRSKSQ